MRFSKLLLLCFLCFRLQAQPLAPENFVHYTTANGLSHNSVRHVLQDGTGFVWIATPSGLNRFNGRRFVQYHSTSDSLSLPSEEISGMTWLNKDLLGVYSSGLHIIHTKTGKRHNLFVPYHRKQLQYKFNGIVQAKGDAEGNLYVLTGSGFYHFDKQHNLLSRYDHYKEAEVPVAYFVFGRELFTFDDDRLLIVAIDGFYVYHKKLRQLKKMTDSDCPLLADFQPYPKQFYTFFQPLPGQLFAVKAHSDSLFYLNFKEKKTVVSRLPFNAGPEGFHWRSRLARVNDSLYYVSAHETGFYQLRFWPRSGKLALNPQKFFPQQQCQGLLVDREQKLWVATAKGLFRQDEGRSQVSTTPLPEAVEKRYPNAVFDGLFVTETQVMAGTRFPGNMLVFDKKTFRFESLTDLEALRKQTGNPYNIYTLKPAGKNALLAAANGAPVLFNRNGKDPRTLSLPGWNNTGWASDVFTDSKGELWISTVRVYRCRPSGAVFSIIPDEELLKNGVEVPEVIREDGDGNFWMTRNGLSRYNLKKGCFDLRLDSFPYLKIPDQRVSVLEIEKGRNTMWWASSNNGLLSYDIGRKTFRHFTTADGLPDNNISALAVVGNRLWVAGTTGLASLDLRTFTITGFGTEDGFPDMPVLNKADFFYDSAAQTLYLAFAKAVARFRPDELLQTKKPPQVFIEEVVLGDREPVFLPSGVLTTSWKKSEARITIGTVNFTDAAGMRYAYRIAKEASSGWTDLGTQTSFAVSSLPPGQHTIEVKVYSAAHRWPDQIRRIRLSVTPPFWQEAWFVFLLSALLVAAVYGLVRWRTTVVRRKEMVNTQIEKLKAENYKAQFELEQISNYFSSSLADKKTEEAVLWDVARNLIGRLHYEDCIIYLWNDTKTKMVQKAAYGPKGEPEIIKADSFTVSSGQGIVGHVMQTGKPVLVHDTSRDVRYRVDDQFRLSEVAVPIVHNNELLGVIDSENSKANYYSQRDVKILTTIAALIANKLKQVQSEQTLEAKQRELAGINEQLAEAKLAALQAQMNPHFIFNALNSIKRMILDGDNDKASRYLSKFALMIRMTLEHARQVFVKLDENIEYLKAYLDMEKLRFDDSFAYSIQTDDVLDGSDTLLPSMMMQPLVENAIWHGLMQAKSGKQIKIAFAQSGGRLLCTVEDNGIGLKQAEELRKQQRPLHRSVGLENLQNRIRIINEKYNVRCRLHLLDLCNEGGCGTRAVLEMNLLSD